MPIYYQINQNLELLCTLFYGNVAKGDAINYAIRVDNDPNNMYCSRTLAVLKKSNLIFNIEDVEIFSRKMAMNKSISYRDKIALLIESPSDTVAATIYSQALNTMRRKVSIELFYTLEAALNYLCLSDSIEEVQEIINKTSKENTL